MDDNIKTESVPTDDILDAIIRNTNQSNTNQNNNNESDSDNYDNDDELLEGKSDGDSDINELLEGKSDCATGHNTTTINNCTQNDTIVQPPRRKMMRVSTSPEAKQADNSHQDVTMVDAENDNTNKEVRGSSSPPKQSSSSYQDEKMEDDTNNKEVLSKLLQVLKEAESISKSALNELGGELTEATEATVGEKVVQIKDATKFLDLVVKQVTANAHVQAMEGVDMSGVITSMIEKDTIINLNTTSIAVDSTETDGGKMGDGIAGSLKAKKITQGTALDGLVNGMSNLEIRNMTPQQEAALIVDTVRTGVNQYLKQQKKSKKEKGKRRLPTAYISNIVEMLSSIPVVEGVVQKISNLLLCETVQETRNSNEYGSLSMDLQRSMNEFWNGYPENVSPIYDATKGDKNAVDDRLCYIRLKRDSNDFEEEEEGESRSDDERYDDDDDDDIFVVDNDDDDY